jgi:purine nucleoside permease
VRIASIPRAVVALVIGATLVQPWAQAQTDPTRPQLAPKVIVLTAFPPEWHAWSTQQAYHYRTLRIRGLIKPLLCDRRDVCVTESGEGEMNAAITVTRLVTAPLLDVNRTIFIRSGIAGGVDAKRSALGSVYINSWIVSWAFGHHYLGARRTLAWAPPGCANYAPAGLCSEYTRDTEENLAYRVNPQLLRVALTASAGVHLHNTAAARKLDAKFAIDEQPRVRVGATITGDDFWIGRQNQAIAQRIVRLYTHGAARYRDTAMEDLGDIAALARFGLARHYLSIRGISDIDIPPPGVTQAAVWKSGDIYTSRLAEQNAMIVTRAVIDAVLKQTHRG